MAIRIKQFNKVTGVTATLKAGGNLEPNTTYYIKIAVSEVFGDHELRSLNARNDGSDTISLTTTDTDLSADISWDEVTGHNMSNYSYFVFISDEENVWNGKKCNKRWYIIGANPDTTYSLEEYSSLYTAYWHGYAFAFMQREHFGDNDLIINGISMNDGLVTIQWDGEIYPIDIWNQAVADGLERYFYHDNHTFSIMGGIIDDRGSSGASATLVAEFYAAFNFLGSTAIKGNNPNMSLEFGRASTTGVVYARGTNINVIGYNKWTYLYAFLSFTQGTVKMYGGHIYGINLFYLFASNTTAVFDFKNSMITAGVQTGSHVVFSNMLLNTSNSQMYGSAFYDCTLHASGDLFTVGGLMYRTKVKTSLVYFLNIYSNRQFHLNDVLILNNNSLLYDFRWTNVDARVHIYISLHITTVQDSIITIDNDNNNALVYEYLNDTYNTRGNQIISNEVTADANGEAKFYLKVYESRWGGDNYHDTIHDFLGNFTIKSTFPDGKSSEIKLEPETVYPEMKILLVPSESSGGGSCINQNFSKFVKLN